MATRKATKGSSKGTTNARVTRAAAARVPSMIEAPAPPKTATAEKAKTRARKPLVNKNNAQPPSQKNGKSKTTTKQVPDDDDREPIKAFLRIRPNTDATEESTTPYLKSLSETTVQMSDLSGTNRIRMHPQAQVYTFNHVFPPETHQPEFFAKTTLPIVRDLLNGQNGLIFAYGVTNSGKTYTIQGGTESDTAGLLPRTLDVVFNSLEGLHSNLTYRPVRVSGVEQTPADEPQYILPNVSDEKAIAEALGEVSSQGVDTTSISVDRNYEYSIWISYAEVYNEKVYDLLSTDSSDGDDNGGCATPQRSSGASRSGTMKRLPRSTTTWSSLASLASAPSSDVLLVKRKALSLKKDPEGGGKYVAGLKCVRVRSTEEAKRVFRTGNINRRVFGTLTNAVSSRSHGIFTLRVVRVHRADHTDVSVSRLSIVDLAGSERTKNTHTTGDRLKEAGSINKSLMVLGQCMEAMRSNQRRLAAMLAAPGRGAFDPSNPNPGVKLAIIPFRHSKLTELFQDFFTGEQGGCAVMIVNVNPYDTGFDENSHVMRFAALAREVTTAPANATKATIRQTPTAATRVFSGRGAQTPHRRTVTIATGRAGAKRKSEAHVEIIEEDEESDGDGEPVDLLVDALFEELEDLRIKLYESEMRCAVIETETREEVMQEMEARIMDMERVFAKRLKHAVEHSEAKTDAKIDMLHQFGAFNANPRSNAQDNAGDASFESVESGSTEDSQEIIASDSQITENVSEDEDDEEFSDDPLAEFSETEEAETTYDDSTAPSPLKYKTLSKAEKEKLRSGSSVIGLRDEDMGIDELDADETMTAGGISEEDDEDDETGQGGSEADDDDDDDDEDDWMPEPDQKSTPKARAEVKVSKGTNSSAKPRSTGGVTKLQKKLDELSLYADDDEEDDEEKENLDKKSPTPKGKRVSTKKVEVGNGVRRSGRHAKN